jgi:hypothetical protein
MKAETVVTSIHNARSHKEEVEYIKIYARQQIEKDRIDAANSFFPRAITQDGQQKQMESIINRPITLD